MRKSLIVLIALMATVLVACDGGDADEAIAGCLNRDKQVKVAQGTQPVRFRPYNKVDLENATIDARGAVWRNENFVGSSDDFAHRYPVVVEQWVDTPRKQVCLVGGRIESNWPDTATDPNYTWSGFWHKTTGLMLRGPNAKIIGTSLVRQGDGIDFDGRNAKDWKAVGVHMNEIHDDCIENDEKHSGLVSEALLDGCYVAFSSRGAVVPTDSPTLTVQRSLVRLQRMKSVFRPHITPSPSHGPFFKWDATAPKVIIRDSVFRADALPGILGDKLSLPAGTVCLGTNTFVWGGGTPVPELPKSLTDCFDVTTDVRFWNDAVTDWHADHDAPL